MKHINAKRVAAVAVGTALLGMGLAFAASATVSFQNTPIINSAGQPVVQIVLGYNGTYPAQITDGVAAADIAAAIGNLAYKTVPVSVNVNTTMAKSLLHPVVSSSAYKLTNQQVWLNESSSAVISGSYSFGALIGSVLNRGLRVSEPLDTKMVSNSTTTEGYPEGNSTTVTESPYTAISYVPLNNPVSANVNGGGVSFSTFTSKGPSNSSIDNILRVSNVQMSSLMSNYGANGENEYLWLTGFPVYDQANSTFALLDAGGAYQVSFNKPIAAYSSTNSINHASIMFLNQNYTIANYSYPSSTSTSSSYVTGGSLELSKAVTPLTTLYLDHFLNASNFGVELAGFTEPNSSGVSQPIYHIYYNGSLVNTTRVDIGTTKMFNVSGKHIYVYVKKAAADVFESASYAKTQLDTDVFNVTSGSYLNMSGVANKGWIPQIEWTNDSSTGGKSNELQGIVVYNQTPKTLMEGQSFPFITNPAIWKLDFEGQSLTSGDYDPVTISLSKQSGLKYINKGANSTITNVTEPGQVMTVTSTIPNAFSYDGQVSSSVKYLLTPYELKEPVANAMAVTNNALEVSLSETNGNYITSSNPLVVTLTGSPSNTVTTSRTESVTFDNTIPQYASPLYNITSITVNRALPDITVYANAIDNITSPSESNTIGKLSSISTGKILLPPNAGKSYNELGAAGNVIYNQQNGQPSSTFALSEATNSNNGIASGLHEYFTYKMNEYDVPDSTSSNDSLSFAIMNSTSGVSATPLFNLNYSTSSTGYSHNNLTYTSSQGKTIKAPVGFITEKGSKVASITPTQLVVNMAKAVDKLQFYVAPVNVSVVSHVKTYGPYSIGEATNIPNVTIANVSAKISVSKANYTIAGLSNLSSAVTTTPSTADEYVDISNMTVPGSPTGLVILDTQAKPTNSLILIGSGYVNTLSEQLQKAYNISITNTTAPIAKVYPSSSTVGGPRVLIAGYTGNQTLSAAKTFIQDLYANAASS